MNGVVTSSGHALRLGKVLGRGGEGTVYEVEGRADLALKVYLPGLAPERHPKIQAMISGQWARMSSFVAFPLEALFDARGNFVGFAMRRVGGYQAIHQLYGPSSRKAKFPKADFRFLIRAASNVAAAVAAVHQTGCIIGDINHSGVMVSDKATVTLIDSDSFQVVSNGKYFACKVGVPEFTPPELQGLDLGTVRRTTNHDCFGLAVLVFQLLFMGRHPFAGTPLQGRDQQLSDWIKAYRFAYSPRQDVTHMKPPPGSPTLADIPPAIAMAFQQAFEKDALTRGRPPAANWVSLLHHSEREITACRANPAHYYYRAAPVCPWCRMEQHVPGMVLFIPASGGVIFGSFEIGGLTAALNGIFDPGPAPAVSTVVVEPINLALSTNGLQALAEAQRRYGILSGGVVAGGLTILLSPSLTLVGLAIIVGSWLILKRMPDGKSKLQASKQLAENLWEKTQRTWEAEAGNQKFRGVRDQGISAIRQLAALPEREKGLLRELEHDRRESRLIHFLEGNRIDQAKIARVGRGRRLQLASHGIETAADISKQRLLGVSGIGEAIASELVLWRRSLEASFVFNPGIPVDPSDVARVKARVAGEKASKVGEIRRLIHALDQLTTGIKAERRALQNGLQSSYHTLKQSEHDLNSASVRFATLVESRPFLSAIAAGVLIGAVLPAVVFGVQTSGVADDGFSHAERNSHQPATMARPRESGNKEADRV